MSELKGLKIKDAVQGKVLTTDENGVVISSNVDVPKPNYSDDKYNKCVVLTDDDELELVSVGGGAPTNNLYDNSSPTLLAGYVSEPSADHPTGLFTLNNSTQLTLAIPITSYMEGQTIRISASSSSHNRWKIGKHSSLPSVSYTDITYIANTYTTDSGRDYVDISIYDIKYTFPTHSISYFKRKGEIHGEKGGLAQPERSRIARQENSKGKRKRLYLLGWKVHCGL